MVAKAFESYPTWGGGRSDAAVDFTIFRFHPEQEEVVSEDSRQASLIDSPSREVRTLKQKRKSCRNIGHKSRPLGTEIQRKSSRSS